MHVTILGWNVNNKEECPSVQRVQGGRREVMGSDGGRVCIKSLMGVETNGNEG